MPRRHRHWPKTHPYYEAAPFCDLPTKKECDARYRAWQKERAETIKAKIALEEAERKARRELSFQTFIDRENQRALEKGPPV